MAIPIYDIKSLIYKAGFARRRETRNSEKIRTETLYCFFEKHFLQIYNKKISLRWIANCIKNNSSHVVVNNYHFKNKVLYHLKNAWFKERYDDLPALEKRVHTKKDMFECVGVQIWKNSFSRTQDRSLF